MNKYALKTIWKSRLARGKGERRYERAHFVMGKKTHTNFLRPFGNSPKRSRNIVELFILRGRKNVFK